MMAEPVLGLANSVRRCRICRRAAGEVDNAVASNNPADPDLVGGIAPSPEIGGGPTSSRQAEPALWPERGSGRASRPAPHHTREGGSVPLLIRPPSPWARRRRRRRSRAPAWRRGGARKPWDRAAARLP